MVDAHEKCLFDNLDTELLAQFPLERRDGLLAITYFAARKFPQTGERMIAAPLGDEDSTDFVAQDAGGYANGSQVSLPWHCLYFLPEPQGQGSLRPTFLAVLTNGV